MECLLNINDKFKLYDDVEILSSELDIEKYWVHVLEEVKRIKDYFTTEEIQKLINEHLTPEDIDGTNYQKCIYGTMLGSCFDDRAHEFIFTLPVVVKSGGKFFGDIPKEKTHRGFYFLTPMEHYITPMEEEEYFDELDYTPEYYERVKRVLNLFK